MSSTEKILRLLVLYPRKKWMQVELAKKAGCSKAYVSKLMKNLQNQGIAIKLKREIIVLSFARLLNKWCSIRKPMKAIYAKSNKKNSEILKILKKEDYALTLFSGAWHRVKYMKTSTLEIYIKKARMKAIIKKIGKISKNPTKIKIFAADELDFEKSDKINNLKIVSVVQNYADLMNNGGTGARVAVKLAEKYNLLGI